MKPMKWPPEKRDELTRLCMAGEMSNKELSTHFDLPVAEIYAARSALGITIDKCKAAREHQKPGPVRELRPADPVFDLSQINTWALIQELVERKVARLLPARTSVLLIKEGKL